MFNLKIWTGKWSRNFDWYISCSFRIQIEGLAFSLAGCYKLDTELYFTYNFLLHFFIILSWIELNFAFIMVFFTWCPKVTVVSVYLFPTSCHHLLRHLIFALLVCRLSLFFYFLALDENLIVSMVCTSKVQIVATWAFFLVWLMDI